MEPVVIRKRESAAIMQSLGSGVVPRSGLNHIVVGRVAEIKQIASELESVRAGAAVVKFISGPFGSGKSFMLALIRQAALANRFVVAEADFSPERRLFGEGKGVATYSALMNGLSTQTKPDGQALQALLERWISQVQGEVANQNGMDAVPFDDPAFVQKVQAAIRQIMSQVEELTGGFDFAEVVNAYYRGYAQENEHLMRSALRWLRAEYTTRTDARRDLGVRAIIDDTNWYDHLKVFARFVTQIGYAGVVVSFDEAINLYKISHAQNREKNYEVVLSIFNDCQQGRVSNIYVLFAGTPEFISDERRGLSSYEALKRRIQVNPYETDQYRDLSQPVLGLLPLKPEEMLALLMKIRAIHATHHNAPPLVTDVEVRSFLTKLLSRPGAIQFLTASDVVRSFLNVLNLLHQNPTMDRAAMLDSAVIEAERRSKASLLQTVEAERPDATVQDASSSATPVMSRFHVKP